MSNNNILGLPPINSNYGFGMNQNELNPESKALSKSEIKETNQDSIRRRVAMDIIATNSDQAIQRVTIMDQNAFVAFYKSTQFIVEMNMESPMPTSRKTTSRFSFFPWA